MRDLETLDFDVVTVSCSMRLRSHLEPYLSNKKYLVPNLDSSGLKTKEELMDDHKAKIRKSDAILVLHDGKIGESVTEEIEYARYLCKPVFFLKVA